MGTVDFIDPAQVSDGRCPSSRQIYKLASMALAALGRDMPESRRAATELINELQVAHAVHASDGVRREWAASSYANLNRPGGAS